MEAGSGGGTDHSTVREEAIRGVGANVFSPSLEDVLDEALAFSTWALMSITIHGLVLGVSI